MAVALITGASRGLGRALAEELADWGWSLVIDGRDADVLAAAAASMRQRLGDAGSIIAIAGDVASERHRTELVAAVTQLGRLDLLVNNASTLGRSPLVRLEGFGLDDLRRVHEVNVLAPLALVQSLLPLLRAGPRPTVMNLSSDAAVEHFDTWGAYGSSKATLDHLTATLGVELPSVRFLAVDPGDMRTAMHQEAFPGEDISDRPLPETVVPAFLALIQGDFTNGRYRAAEIAGER
ncbi:MAG: SDR family oxidoreductase [Acidimicrobiales bacterium]|jgi:NAD(P)-dependent dehydrogenase (short-subunit alcohol dehydrogenase family)